MAAARQKSRTKAPTIASARPIRIHCERLFFSNSFMAAILPRGKRPPKERANAGSSELRLSVQTRSRHDKPRRPYERCKPKCRRLGDACHKLAECCCAVEGDVR